MWIYRREYERLPEYKESYFEQLKKNSQQLTDSARFFANLERILRREIESKEEQINHYRNLYEAELQKNIELAQKIKNMET